MFSTLSVSDYAAYVMQALPSARHHGYPMTDDTSSKEIARRARLTAALRENLKRRKSQAKGRAVGAIVTPDDEVATRDEGAARSSDQSTD